jgi:hypothetical protein
LQHALVARHPATIEHLGVVVCHERERRAVFRRLVVAALALAFDHGERFAPRRALVGRTRSTGAVRRRCTAAPSSIGGCPGAGSTKPVSVRGRSARAHAHEEQHDRRCAPKRHPSRIYTFIRRTRAPDNSCHADENYGTDCAAFQPSRFRIVQFSVAMSVTVNESKCAKDKDNAGLSGTGALPFMNGIAI